MEQLMNTINGTAARAKRDGLGISTNLIRSLVKSNTIPYVKVGNNQVLINYETFKNFLFTGTTMTLQPETAGQIKPIPERLPIAR